MEIEECESQLCLHGTTCKDALGLTFVTIHMDSLKTTVNLALVNKLVSYVSMEIFVWVEEMTIIVTTQVVNLQGHIVRL